MPEPVRVVSITVIGDTICPFVYLGYKKMQRGISLAETEGILGAAPPIKYEPFMLDPTLSMDKPIDKAVRYNKKYGARWAWMSQGMKEWGRQYGINYSFRGPVRQSIDSHRLLAKAFTLGGQEAQLAVWERIAKAFFEEEHDIGDRQMLADKASDAGVMSYEAALAFLNSNEGYDQYRAGLDAAQAIGVSGVPHVVLNRGEEDEAHFTGAIEPEEWVRLFKRGTTRKF